MLYGLKFLVQTDCTDSFTVTTTLQYSDAISTAALTNLIAVTFGQNGGNKLVDWFLPFYLLYRHPQNTNLYLKIQITNPATGTYMNIKDLVIIYI